MSDEERKILPLQYVKGVGPRRAEVLASEGLVTPEDVLMYVPRGYVDRSAAPSISALLATFRKPNLWNSDAATITKVTAEVTIVAVVADVREQSYGKGRTMLLVVVSDGSGASATLIFWNMVAYYKRVLAHGQHVVISGAPDFDPRWNQITFHHPEIERVEEEDMEQYRAGAILPKYTITQGMRTAGLTLRMMRSIVEHVIDRTLDTMVDPLPEAYVRQHGFMDRSTSLRELHFPSSLASVRSARERMKYEELFFFELMLAVRKRTQRVPELGVTMQAKSPHARALVDTLPFELTAAQRRVIHEITRDMTSGTPMNRLLQGDVGSGKTIVALLCMLCAVDNGYQALIMAPTEILAEQHFNSIKRLLQDTDLQCTQLVGGQRKALRTKVLAEIASGEANIIVGTHAMFESSVQYHKLGLAIIDEQHRFGVEQRAALRRLGCESNEGGKAPHLLVMSATPIPRTLSMTAYGDLDVSVIDELPKDRKPIVTKVVYESGLDSVHAFVREQVAEGRQAYIVYPLVERSEKLELKSAVEHFETLQRDVYPTLKMGLLHGQQLWYEKEDAMRDFLARKYDILVATTVVEVGIDVPNATVMLIENAERFGLSQLHQLRGRVGRGEHGSFCFLATKDHFKYQINRKNAAEDRASSIIRLKTMEETTDGFRIAEVDLTLRGPGDVLGTRQSGLPDFVFTDLVNDTPMIARARQDAFALVDRDPHLRHPDLARTRAYLQRRYHNAQEYMRIA